MRFILLTDYYEPIIKSGSIIIGDLAKELLSLGHEVTIITFVDNHKLKYDISVLNNLKIIRIRVLTRSYGKVGRLWAEISYSNKIIKYLNLNNKSNYDGIICYSPSIFYGKAIRWLKDKYKAKTYLVIRDIFPKWALDSGILKEGRFYQYLKKVEYDLYASSDIIGIEAKSDLNYFHNYGLDKSIEIEVLNNWGSPLLSINDEFGKKLLDKNKVNIVYGGNMGDAQDLLSLINDIDFEILDQKAVLFLIGSGNQFDKIKKIIEKKQLSNIILMATIDRKSYLSVMKNADIGLVSLGRKMLSNNYPLKMIGCMQLKIPILASVNKNNEIIEAISKNNIGLVSLASDKYSFNKNLNTMIRDKSMRKIQGENSILLFNEKFNVNAACSQILRHFK